MRKNVTQKDVWLPNANYKLEKMPQDMDEKIVRDAAREDAEQSKPRVNSKTPKGTEAEIWARTRRGCDQLKTRFSDHVNDCLDLIRDKNHPNLKEFNEDALKEKNFEYVVPSLYQEVSVDIMRNDTENVKLKYETFLRAKQKLINFKIDHKLERDAIYPVSVWGVIGHITVLALAETALNGYMFKDISDGLVGGFFLAIMLSLVNIASGIVLGFFGLRQLFSNLAAKGGAVRKLAGMFFVFIFSIVGVFLNFFVAHVRELSVNFEGGALTNTLDHLKDGPFNLTEPEAFILLVFGLLIFIYSTYKGYQSISDKYPGFKEVNEARVEAEEDYIHSREEIREALSDALTDYVDYKNEEIEFEKNQLKNAKNSLRKLKTIRDTHVNDITLCINSGNALLDLYTTTNVQRRNNVIIPRFKERVPDWSDAPEGLESTGEVEELVKEVGLTQRENAKVYRKQINASISYGKQAKINMENFLDKLKDKVADEIQFGREVYRNDE